MKTQIVFFLFILLGYTVQAQTNTVTDIDGNVYKTVKIGNQIWMAENLKVTKYNDGTPITIKKANANWMIFPEGAKSAADSAYAYMHKPQYGILYNWYVVATGKLAPKGWHIPTDAEWHLLANYIKSTGQQDVGTALKSKSGWSEGDCTDAFGFNALPGGFITDNPDGVANVTTNGYWWSSTSYNEPTAWNRYLSANNKIISNGIRKKVFGYSIRCIKD